MSAEVEKPGDVEGEEQDRWVDFTEEFYSQYTAAESEDDRWRLLASHSTVKHAEDNLRSLILQEYLYQIINFCGEFGVSYDQASGAVKSAQTVFDHCIFRESKETRQSTRDYFEREFTARIRGKPPGTFNIKFVEAFSSFFARTILRNLAAYQYAFRNTQETIEVTELLQVQTAMVPPPLSSAQQEV